MPLDKQRYVLVIDDEEVVTRIFEQAFAGQNDFVLDVAKDVREALEKLSAIQYDIIFLDMKLDGHSWSGMQILREIVRLERRAKSRGQPVLESFIIIMSGSIPFNEFMLEAHELGVLTFIDKRVDFTPDFIRHSMSRLRVPLLPPEIPPLTPPIENGTLPP